MSEKHLSWLVHVALYCCLLGEYVAGVRITKLDVPPVALEGDQVHLRCEYEDETHSSLYSLKWYKNEQEFFRHQPGFTQEGEERCGRHHPYHVDGVSVDCWVSTERDVVLQGVTRATSGDYQCEVIGEHPTFRKQTRKARLTVFSEPLKEPVVTGARESYAPLDTVTLTCTPSNTQYLPLLTWLINGDPVPQDYVKKYQDRRASGLRFVARSDLFVRGVISVSCVASFGSSHVQSGDVTLSNSEYRGTHDFFFNAGARVGVRNYLTATMLVVVMVVVVPRLY